MLSQDYVEKALRDGGYISLFEDETHTALENWYEVIASNPEHMAGALPREKATFLNRKVIERICAKLETDANVVITSAHQTKLITINNEIMLRFKKLTRYLRPMSIQTQRVERLWYENENENQSGLPGEFAQWINVTFGWELSKAGAIRQLAIVSEFRNTLDWFISVTDGAVQHVPVQLALQPVEDANEPAVYVATLRDTKRARDVAATKAQDESEAGT